jgi:hypothetical protein
VIAEAPQQEPQMHSELDRPWKASTAGQAERCRKAGGENDAARREAADSNAFILTL